MIKKHERVSKKLKFYEVDNEAYETPKIQHRVRSPILVLLFKYRLLVNNLKLQNSKNYFTLQKLELALNRF